jgi:hypothetical protein
MSSECVAEPATPWIYRLTALALLRWMAALALLMSFLLPAKGLFGLDICLFHHVTGLPCPGCGMTRAFCAIAHGHFSQAWAIHPFSIPFYGVAVLVLVEPPIAGKFQGLRQPGTQRILGFLGTGLLLAMGIFGLARMLRFYPWP